MITGFFEDVTSPIRLSVVSYFQDRSTTPQDKLQKENEKLQGELAKMEMLQQENQSLRKQLQTANPAPVTLLPAHIVGMGSFIPEVTPLEQIILDKGEKDGVSKGDTVIVQNMLIGIVTKSTAHLSVISLITSKNFSTTVRTLKTNALGVIRGKGEGRMILENVDLTDKLNKNDTVVSKGNIDSNGEGVPPDLVLGNIIAVNKRASDVFQAAEVKNMVDYSKLKIVYINKRVE